VVEAASDHIRTLTARIGFSPSLPLGGGEGRGEGGFQSGCRCPTHPHLHDFLEARVLPKIIGPVGPGNLQYAAMWKVAQRLTRKPVKFGTILPELLAASVADEYYKDPVERTWAISDALSSELGELANAGCPVVQMEGQRLAAADLPGCPELAADIGGTQPGRRRRDYF
jgi:hypothetical protein